MTQLLIDKDDVDRYPRFYNKSLVDEFGQAKGYKKVNISRLFIRNEIEAFVRERTYGINLVRNILNGLYIDYKDSNTIETVNNSEFIISKNTDYDTTVVTSDPKVFNKIRRDRIIFGNLKLYQNRTIIEMQDKKEKLVNPNLFRNILVVNPYSEYLKFYEKKLRNEDFNVIIAECGTRYDKDHDFKVAQMNELLHRIDGQAIKYHAEDNKDNYAFVIASKNARLTK